MTAELTFTTTRSDAPLPDADREAVLANPGFGSTFTDHMALATWTNGEGWHDGQVRAFGPLQLSPAAAVLHYAQEVFEGMKAYRHEDGSVWTFRPDRNAARMARSCERLALPVLPEEDFVGAIRALVQADEAWVPAYGTGETSLYLRPFMFASEAFLGVRPANEVTFSVIASPAGAYFSGGLTPALLLHRREVGAELAADVQAAGVPVVEHRHVARLDVAVERERQVPAALRAGGGAPAPLGAGPAGAAGPGGHRGAGGAACG